MNTTALQVSPAAVISNVVQVIDLRPSDTDSSVEKIKPKPVENDKLKSKKTE